MSYPRRDLSPTLANVPVGVKHYKDRLLLEDQLAQQAETEWRREAEEARRLAREQGIDQAAIDRAVERVRNRS